MGYNRVHLKQHHTLQEDTMTYDYCSDGIIVRPFSATRKLTLKNSSASKRKQEFSEDNKNTNSTDKKICVQRETRNENEGSKNKHNS